MKVTKTLDIAKDGEWVIASTPAPDRDRDRVMPQGINVDNFQRNPALFFGHNYSDPWALIGRVAEFSIGPEGMKFRPELREPASDSDPMHIIRALWDGNLLRASSIGFIPKSYKPNEFGGHDFNEIELLEISLVGLPANQEAVRLAMKAFDLPAPAPEQPADETPAEMPAEPVVKDFAQDAEQKRGRVLSRANESKLRTAHEAIGEVLAQLGEAPADTPADEPASEPEQEQSPAPEAKAPAIEDDYEQEIAARLSIAVKALQEFWK